MGPQNYLVTRYKFRNGPLWKPSPLYLHNIYIILYRWEKGKCKWEQYTEHSLNSLQRLNQLATKRRGFIACYRPRLATFLYTFFWLLFIVYTYHLTFLFSLCSLPHSWMLYVSCKPPGVEPIFQAQGSAVTSGSSTQCPVSRSPDGRTPELMTGPAFQTYFVKPLSILSFLCCCKEGRWG